ncbi:UNVERIFIED_CONTAM: hypothetical protein GTU68_057260 [Idotea baltica]|nr:hypothetical protein [Idotea baltica]
MLVPYEFARIALRHGTVATISDPHEIANVLGLEGVEYMIQNGKHVPLKFHFGAPSCVPATAFETAGATINAEDITTLLASDDIWYLAEMMNYPGVLFEDPEVMAKIAAAHKIGKPVDGHAPGLRGDDAKKYIAAGISTDHECFTLEEAQDKLGFGMKILIREGSAAKNFKALHPLIADHHENLMFCSDDKHPDDLLVGHINELVVRALKLGYDLFDVLTIACINPVHHYKMEVGLLQVGDAADFIVVNSPEEMQVLKTVIGGQVVAESGTSCLAARKHRIVNQFEATPKKPLDFIVRGDGKSVDVIRALDGQLITEKAVLDLPVESGMVQTDLSQDTLKIAVVNRYHDAPVATGFIQNYGLRQGAIASTVAHDSHNIIVVGVDDVSISRAVNLLVECKGGLSAVAGEREEVIPLPVAGLMSDGSGEEIGRAYETIDAFVKGLGCGLRAPFMTLSFMALLVIPKIKMSDLGLFDAESFQFLSRTTPD